MSCRLQRRAQRDLFPARDPCFDPCFGPGAGKSGRWAEVPLLDSSFHGLARWTPLGNGVIGNTAVSGTVIQGSSPCSPALRKPAGRPAFGVFRRRRARFGEWGGVRPGWRSWWRLVVCWSYLAPSSSGLGHHPLKVAARVRIPLGLRRKPRSEPLFGVARWFFTPRCQWRANVFQGVRP
jgi:hypothetical protein